MADQMGFQLVLDQKQLEHAVTLGLSCLGFKVVSDRVTWSKKPISATVRVEGASVASSRRTAPAYIPAGNMGSPALPPGSAALPPAQTEEEIFSRVVPRTVTPDTLPDNPPTVVPPQKEMSQEEIDAIVEAARRRGGM